MTKRKRIAVAASAGLVLLLVVGAVVFIFLGVYNVAATEPHNPVTHWLLKTAKQRSVVARADEVPSPPPVDSVMMQHGFEEYHAMCVVCHGAPGVERSEFGKGINPEPPDLAEEAVEWSDRELFWITKHGIKMAGMPAFGVTHSDQELWSIVAFLRRLQYMPPAEYRRLAAETGARGGMHETQGHPHAAMDRTELQQYAGVPAAEHARSDHSGMAPAGQRRAPAQAPSHQGVAGMDHAAMPRTSVGERPAAAPTRVDTEATEKLKALATELIRDPIVLARIRSDSVLRRRWEDENLRRQLTIPPR